MPSRLLVYRLTTILVFITFSIFTCTYMQHRLDMYFRTHSEDATNIKTLRSEKTGTTWAVLVAGSKGYRNYRHQADVCHAYQILKRGGLKDKNIIVFMYDDIVHHRLNPRPGIIINHPNGSDVYAGVPKDYTGENVTASNFYAVLLGDKDSIKGGSGKVVSSEANDRIFLYYADHGHPGFIGMPVKPPVKALDFIEVLKKKHALGSYKKMVLYIEACYAGSMFSGIMPKNLNIYVITASDTNENSFGVFCPGSIYPPPRGYGVCLGDLYSLYWMEDSESRDLDKHTLKEQYDIVKDKTLDHWKNGNGSHVMEYGSTHFKHDKVSLYQGFRTENFPSYIVQLSKKTDVDKKRHIDLGVSQRDTDLVFMWYNYKEADSGSVKKAEILREIGYTMRYRSHLDTSVSMIGIFLFGPIQSSHILKSVRDSGLPLVDDWECLESMAQIFESHCGTLTIYGMKHNLAFANICNKGVSLTEMEEACVAACGGYDFRELESLALGADHN